MKVTKKFEFEMAHMLANHPSLCKNLHGHSYKLFVTVKGPINNDMVVDFKDLKSIVDQAIINPLDHAFAYNTNSTDLFEQELITLVKEYNKKSFAFPWKTTCENMAKWMFENLNYILKQSNESYYVSKIKLYETSTSFCEYEGE